jgi:hypothetical protein
MCITSLRQSLLPSPLDGLGIVVCVLVVTLNTHKVMFTVSEHLHITDGLIALFAYYHVVTSDLLSIEAIVKSWKK